jgi:hypothetical protein
MKKVSDNQIENIEQWMDFYKKNKKFPHNKIICTKCQNSYISLKGAGLSNLKKQFDGNIRNILKKAICKTCKQENGEVLKKPIENKILTREEMEDRAEEIRKNIPKIDLNKGTDIFNLKKDQKICESITKTSCWRPDIYLDLGCSSCTIEKYCVCPIKNLKRKPDYKRGKIKYNI